MTTDRELLEAAARAAGLHVWPGHGWQSSVLYRAARPHASGLVSGVEWDPLTDDGDRYRLARALDIRIHFGPCYVTFIGADGRAGVVRWPEDAKDDAYAIVQEAAAMANATSPSADCAPAAG